MITLKNLSKTYKVHKKEAGLMNSFKGLFSREYKYIEAVKDINLEIKQGELVGFLGPNGAGKTTTLKMLSGLLYPTAGKATVLGHTPHKREETYLKQISLVMGQKSQLWFDLPTIETFNLNKEIYEVSDTNYKKVLDELTELLEIQDILTQPVRNLSLGQRMKCELVAALIHTPKVLFLDEPTIGLDIVMQKKVREFIKEYNRRYNASVMLTSHYMDDVKEVCQRIVMIDHGTIIFDGNIDTLIKQYADYKTLDVIFNEKVTKKDLEHFGTIVEYSFPKVTINIPRGQISQKAAEVLAKYNVEDVTILEPQLEDIIRKLF